MKWLVAHEGKGPDFVLEVHVAGSKWKDVQRNAAWFARLGIPEYFVFDRSRFMIRGYRLPDAQVRVYQPIVPQVGRYASSVLGLEMTLEGDRLRFYHGSAPLFESEELVGKLESLVDQVVNKQEEAEE